MLFAYLDVMLNRLHLAAVIGVYLLERGGNCALLRLVVPSPVIFT